MQKKRIKKLVIASYSKNNKLDNDTVELIASSLKRKELKEYIKELKRYERSKQLIVELSFKPSKEQFDLLKNNFKDKEVIIKYKPELVFGMRLIENDKIYDLNIQNTLDKLEEYIDQQYD